MGLFHLSSAILFTFHSRYSFTIGVSFYLVLEVWFPFLQTSFGCSTCFSLLCLTGLVYPLCSGVVALTTRVSLATTSRISLDFFSSGYLDASVPQVFSIEVSLFGFPNFFSSPLGFLYLSSFSLTLGFLHRSFFTFTFFVIVVLPTWLLWFNPLRFSLTQLAHTGSRTPVS